MTFEASRSKQVLILQPRGKPLYEDGQGSFGLKMLQNMGWKKGNGLGRNQQGKLDFIQVRYKNNASGLGFDHLKDNQWTDTEHNFNALLQNLNSKSNSNSNDEESNEGTKAKSATKSLEEMSKQSRARVHYKKFTKGKDVYKYSEKDLANIFGKKSLDEKRKVVEPVESESSNEPDHYKSNMIVNTGISITDYFNQKRNKEATVDNSDIPMETVEKSKKKKQKLDLEVPADDVEVTETKPKKKKLGIEMEPESSSNLNDEPKGKKKKNKKIEETVTDNQEPEKEVEPKKRKRRDIEESSIELQKEEEVKPKKEKEKIVEPESTETNPAEEKASTQPLKVEEPERLRGANAVYSTDIIQIPTYIAHKMSKMTVNKFARANIGNIVGYGMTEDIEIKVIQSKAGDTSLSTDKYSIYSMDKVIQKRVNPRKILSKIKRTKKSIQVI